MLCFLYLDQSLSVLLSFPQCPDSACKQDLLAYLQRIALYCHQLNICSKVKAEVQNLGGELIVSGVSSAATQVCVWWMHFASSKRFELAHKDLQAWDSRSRSGVCKNRWT